MDFELDEGVPDEVNEIYMEESERRSKEFHYQMLNNHKRVFMPLHDNWDPHLADLYPKDGCSPKRVYWRTSAMGTEVVEQGGSDTIPN